MSKIPSAAYTYAIKLNSGRSLRLTDLYLRKTYSEGLDKMPKRAEILAELEDEAPDLVAGVDTVLILEPEGLTSRLAEVTCIAHLISEPLEPDSGTDASGLTVVWFQNEFIFPPSDEVLKSLQSLEWDKLADDFEN